MGKVQTLLVYLNLKTTFFRWPQKNITLFYNIVQSAINWRNDHFSVGQSEMMFGPRKCVNSLNVCVSWATRTDNVCWNPMSIVAPCQYVNYMHREAYNVQGALNIIMNHLFHPYDRQHMYQRACILGYWATFPWPRSPVWCRTCSWPRNLTYQSCLYLGQQRVT